jgi:F0F1-type ATP synthase assembly protein I
MPAVKREKEDKSENKQVIKGFWFLFQVGWFVALSIVLPTALGLWLDTPQMWNSRPLCTLIGFLLGTSVAVYGLYRMFKQFLAEQTNKGKNNESMKEQNSE